MADEIDTDELIDKDIKVIVENFTNLINDWWEDKLDVNIETEQFIENTTYNVEELIRNVVRD